MVKVCAPWEVPAHGGAERFIDAFSHHIGIKKFPIFSLYKNLVL
jgi:hypothetical protein